MDRNHPREAIEITHSRFYPFTDEQSQCAVVVPGIVSQIVLVNHNNNVFGLKFANSRWKPTKINIRLEDGFGEVFRAY